MAQDGENDPGNKGDLGGFRGEFDKGLDGGDLIQFLEIALAEVSLVAGSGHHDGRPGVGGGVGEAGEAVDAAGAGDGEEEAGAGCEVAVGGSCVSGGLFVVEGDETDAEGDGAGGERCHRDAHDAEQVFDARAGEDAGGQNVTIDFRIRHSHSSKVAAQR